MLSEKIVREREGKTVIPKKAKEAARQLGTLKPHFNLPISCIDLQVQRLNNISADLPMNFEIVNEDAQKILMEAAKVAKGKQPKPDS